MKVRLLDTKDARNTWEDLFSAHYIEPVLGDLNQLLNSTMKDMVNDTALGKINQSIHQLINQSTNQSINNNNYKHNE